ncbi:YitT family protein [Alsobacter sp. R-9]
MAGDTPSPHAHRPYEDIAAVLTGTLVVAVGITLLAKGGLITGGTAGLALLAGYATGAPFSVVFFLLNLPFYALSVARMGWTLTLRTVIAVTLVSAFARFVPQWMTVSAIDPLFAAVAGGTLAGLGLLILFRHRTSLGGVNILALYAQERHGWRAGNVQLGIDVAILAAAVWMVGPERGALSALAALMLNLVITLNHRPGRYTGFS